MLRPFYFLFVSLYPSVARVLSLFNPKAALWVKGRKQIFDTLSVVFQHNTSPVIWFHCASLGEFEQGKPVMEWLLLLYPDYKLLVTFFSPSGYEIRKNYSKASLVCYLPIDGRINAKKFVDIVKPSLVIFVKYEFWFYYLNELKQQQIKLLLVSGLFRKTQPFFKWYGGFYRRMLKCFTHIFVQTDTSLQLLQSIHITNASISGDTRFDRVLITKNSFEPIELIKLFCREKKVLVAGSTWTEDDEELDHFIISHPDMRFIIASHDISEERLSECERLYKNTIRFSRLKDGAASSNINTLIIDNIGMLSRLYYYADICYVGGAFGGDGIHNILEAAVFGKPVIFGPNHEKFPEASELIDAGGAFTIDNALELEGILNDLLDKPVMYAKACEASGNYAERKAGATKKIISFIQEKRLLTN